MQFRGHVPLLVVKGERAFVVHSGELAEPLDPASIESIISFTSFVDDIDIPLNDGAVQNALYPVLEASVLGRLEEDGAAEAWGSSERAVAASMLALAQRFNFNVDRWLSWLETEEDAMVKGEE